MIQKNIEIIVSEDESFGSMQAPLQRSVQQVLLQSYDDVRVTRVSKIRDLDTVIGRKPHLVFLGTSRISHNSSKEAVWISDYLEEGGIACTGSGSDAHFLERNKAEAKKIVRKSGFASPRSIIVAEGNGRGVIMHDLKYPLFVKPIDKGGGIGVDGDSYVTDHHELEAKVLAMTHAHETDALVEEYLPGREFSVAVMYDETAQAYAAMPLELQSDKNERGASMLSNHVKRTDSETVTKIKDTELAAYIAEQGLGMFHAIGGRGYGRIDIRLDADGVANFLEANLLPGLTEDYGSFPRACLIHKGWSYTETIHRIASVGLERLPQKAV